jgi:hypothetical protein
MRSLEGWRHKPDEPAGGDPFEDLDSPRCHHYTLAHYALRGVALRHPLGFLGILASEDATAFLEDLMKSVSENCKPREPQAGFTVSDLTIHKLRVGPYPAVAIQMPPPRATTEAYFVLAVLLVDLDQELPEGEATLRYFTLEKGFTLEGGSRTVLCEWTSQGSHANYGDGPEPRLAAFALAVEDLLSRQSS